MTGFVSVRTHTRTISVQSCMQRSVDAYAQECRYIYISNLQLHIQLHIHSCTFTYTHTHTYTYTYMYTHTYIYIHCTPHRHTVQLSIMQRPLSKSPAFLHREANPWCPRPTFSWDKLRPGRSGFGSNLWVSEYVYYNESKIKIVLQISKSSSPFHTMKASSPVQNQVKPSIRADYGAALVFFVITAVCPAFKLGTQCSSMSV